MECLRAYSTSAKDGGVHIDTEGMAVDLITVMKAGGYTKDMFIGMIKDLC